MKITRISILTGETHTRFISGLTEEAIKTWEIENFPYPRYDIPNISEDDNRFLGTGITPEEWVNRIPMRAFIL